MIKDGKWIPDGTTTRDFFGGDVDVSGHRVIGGAHATGQGDHYAEGAAYIIDRETGREYKLVARDPVKNDQFGKSVGIDGDLAAVGAFGVKEGAGAVYLFEFFGGEWIETVKFDGSQTVMERLGKSVNLDEGFLVAAAQGNPRDPSTEERGVQIIQTDIEPPPPPPPPDLEARVKTLESDFQLMVGDVITFSEELDRQGRAMDVIHEAVVVLKKRVKKLWRSR